MKALMVPTLLFFGIGFTQSGAAQFSDAENRKTAAWILSAYDRLSGEVNDLQALKAVLPSYAELDGADSAFGKLQACRTVVKYKANPLTLVAAEHYAFMRYEASKTGDLKLRQLPKKYHDTKIKLINEGKEDRLKTTDWPLSPPSEDTLAWANLGVEHGLADYEKREQKKPANGTEADILEAQMKLAASSAFFAWIGRTFGTAYTRTGNENCAVVEPQI
ncbi:hypothetical protein FHX10_002572 [Rhizobium sp. BK591]|uniref:hypothetical protein n=1 Tax=Rhizobium sp. BK591 TaxID=2586985 RepID=UPI00161ADD44|nr:hypothetical protein [Rhizobium sp. BK591]MBB3743079.1 hypothetical protein [Rhizobium sp. BK591]